jgi:CubicO group peptidase (beta-lactamase class C family)
MMTKLTGMKASAFADKRHFEPLGMHDVRWDDSEVGYSNGSSGLFMTLRDVAKLGYLYFNNGKWDGVRIVPPEWVRDSTARHIIVEPGNRPKVQALEDDDGYFWHVNSAGKYSMYVALGGYKETIVAVPDLCLVIVTTESRFGGSGTEHLLLMSKPTLPSIIR